MRLNQILKNWLHTILQELLNELINYKAGIVCFNMLEHNLKYKFFTKHIVCLVKLRYIYNHNYCMCDIYLNVRKKIDYVTLRMLKCCHSYTLFLNIVYALRMVNSMFN